MATYVVLSKLNSEGLRNIRKAPDRFQEIADEIKAADGKVIEQWATLGPYDFCALVSAADNAAIHRMAVDQAGTGRVRFTILPAIDLPLFIRLMGQTTETTGPYTWQIKWWAQIARRAMRYRVITRHVKAACDPMTIEGRENLKQLRGPAIFIGNHSSHLDSLVLLHSLPERYKRRLTFGGAADRWFLKGRKGYAKQGWYNSLSLNTFPVRRGAGSATLDYPKWLIDRNWSVMIFPEGTRSSTGKMAKFKHGVSILALEKKVPVVPVYMEGLAAIRPKGSTSAGRGPVTVKIGSPIHFPEGTTVPEATHMMQKAMEALRAEVHHPRHTVVPVVQPEEREAAAS